MARARQGTRPRTCAGTRRLTFHPEDCMFHKMKDGGRDARPPRWIYNRRFRFIMRIFLSLGLLLSVFASAQAVRTKTPLPKFEDVAKQVGLTVSHISSPEKRYIVESMSGGVGLIDCDNDGRLDIITVNGSTVDRYKQGGDPMVTLYHQDDGFEFTDITKSAGLTR